MSVNLIKVAIVSDRTKGPVAVASYAAAVYNVTGGAEFFCISDAVALEIERMLNTTGCSAITSFTSFGQTRKIVTCGIDVDYLIARGDLTTNNGFDVTDLRQKP